MEFRKNKKYFFQLLMKFFITLKVLYLEIVGFCEITYDKVRIYCRNQVFY